jgi:hypothetical protein
MRFSRSSAAVHTTTGHEVLVVEGSTGVPQGGCLLHFSAAYLNAKTAIDWFRRILVQVRSFKYSVFRDFRHLLDVTRESNVCIFDNARSASYRSIGQDDFRSGKAT